MTETTAEATVEEFWERVWNGGEVSAIDELVGPEFVLHTSGTPVGPRDEFTEWVERFQARIGDLRFVIEDLFSSGDRVVTRWRIEGTQRGMFDLPATDDPISFTGITIFVVEDGRLREGWVERSAYELFQELRGGRDGEVLL